MSELQERLDQIHEEFESGESEATLEIMHRANDELVASGRAQRAVHEGALFPDFSLEDSDGGLVQSDSLLDKGPIIVSFFRGFW